MRTLSMIRIARSFVVIGVLALSGNALAAGPLLICTNGQPFLWPGGGANVPFNPDKGGLGILNNVQATAAVEDAFQSWEDVPSATITYQNTGQLPIDVDVTNYGPFLNAPAPDGLSAIVFDNDGAIFTDLFGPGSGILGFASPEWVDPTSCEILEGFSFLNGPAIVTLEGLLDLMVHEFGHYSNLAHTVVNGQQFIGAGDTSGPNPEDTFGLPPDPDNAEVIETMYPFLFTGIDQVSRTPNPDDIASISRLYPEPTFASSTATIEGTIFLGATKVTGVNVIARNVANPFFDAVSAISSDYTDDFSQANALTGVYSIGNLTPAANYAVYVDEILAGGFSTPPSSPLPGPEEFYNGALESSDGSTDIPNVFVAVSAAAGGTASGIDVIFNGPQPGEPLNTGDDGYVPLALPFEYCVAGKAYSTVFVNGNGYLTFGAQAGGLTFIESAAAFTSGPPRIAGFWDDLNVNDGGMIFYGVSGDEFSVTWQDVPEFFFGGANTFTITLTQNTAACLSGTGLAPPGRGATEAQIDIGDISSPDGLVGISGGTFATSGFEGEVDVSSSVLSMRRDAAVYEQFSGDVDVANTTLQFSRVGPEYTDRGDRRGNDSADQATLIRLPYDTATKIKSFSSISPAAADIDWFRFNEPLAAGDSVIAEILTGDVDTVMGLFFCDTPGVDEGGSCDPADLQLVAFNDDANGLLSRIEAEVPLDGTYLLAVTFCCDYDFDGVDPGQGDPFDWGRYTLDVFSIAGTLLPLTDESTIEYELGFNFPFQGSTYSSVWVNSNGYLTFGAGETFQFIPNVADLENGLPRIAPLWVDLDPGAGGMILANSDGTSATISYMGVPEFFFGGSNTMSVTLDSSGGISFSYAGMTAPEGITGVAEGGGALGTAVDLSSGGPWSASGTTYEEFIFIVSDFDLDGSAVTFD